MKISPQGSPIPSRALLMIVTALPLCGSAQGAGKKRNANVSPAASLPVAGVAHLRIWKADLPGIKSVEFARRPGGGAAGSTRPAQRIGSLGTGCQFQSYTEVPAGPCILEVAKPGVSPAVATVPADLAAGSYVTLLVTPADAAKSGAAQAELIRDGDTMAGTATGGASFALRNLTPGVHDVRVTVGDAVTAQFGSSGASLRLTGLTPGIYTVRTTGKDAAEKPFDWTTEGDFNRYRRQTLLIYPDPYGRLRPRLTVDGPAATPDTPNKNGAQS